MKNLLIVISVFLFTGCAGSGVVYIPDQVINDNSLLSISQKYVEAVCSEVDLKIGCNNKGDIKTNSWLDVMQKCQFNHVQGFTFDCVTARNHITNELLLVIDHNYHKYEGGLLAGKAKSNFYTNALRTSLETAATLLTPASTVKILSGAAALTGAIKSSAEKEFYFENTIGVLIIQMRADRKKKLFSLMNGLKGSYSDYSLERAVREINDYYRAGTLASSIISLSNIAANKESKADERLNCLAFNGSNCHLIN